MFIFIFSLFLPWSVLSPLVKHLVTAILKEDVSRFLLDDFMPELKKSVAQVSSIGLSESLLIVKMTVGVLIKIGWAFVWQEVKVPVPKSLLYNEYAMTIASLLTPFLNMAASSISGIVQTDDHVVNSKSVYPGSL